MGLKRDKELPNVPLATDLARTDEDRQVLKLYSTAPSFGYPMLTGQSVPHERVALLRKAFRDTMRDPTFLKEAKKARFEVAPVYGEDLQQSVEAFLKYPPAIVAKAKAMLAKKSKKKKKKKH